jgi:DHA2 family multidrug resistance protein
MSSSIPSATPAPLSGFKLALGAFAVALATFMNVLDSSVANVAIPTLSGDLGVSVDEGTWVITVFAAANAVVIPLTGWVNAAHRPGEAVRRIDFAIRDFIRFVRTSA